MKSIEDTVCEIDERLMSLELDLKDARHDHRPGRDEFIAVGATAIAVLRSLKEWILEL